MRKHLALIICVGVLLKVTAVSGGFLSDILGRSTGREQKVDAVEIEAREQGLVPTVDEPATITLRKLPSRTTLGFKDKVKNLLSWGSRTHQADPLSPSVHVAPLPKAIEPNEPQDPEDEAPNLGLDKYRYDFVSPSSSSKLLMAQGHETTPAALELGAPTTFTTTTLDDPNVSFAESVPVIPPGQLDNPQLPHSDSGAGTPSNVAQDSQINYSTSSPQINYSTSSPQINYSTSSPQITASINSNMPILVDTTSDALDATSFTSAASPTSTPQVPSEAPTVSWQKSSLATPTPSLLATSSDNAEISETPTLTTASLFETSATKASLEMSAPITTTTVASSETPKTIPVEPTSPASIAPTTLVSLETTTDPWVEAPSTLMTSETLPIMEASSSEIPTASPSTPISTTSAATPPTPMALILPETSTEPSTVSPSTPLVASEIISTPQPTTLTASIVPEEPTEPTEPAASEGSTVPTSMPQPTTLTASTVPEEPTEPTEPAASEESTVPTSSPQPTTPTVSAVPEEPTEPEASEESTVPTSTPQPTTPTASAVSEEPSTSEESVTQKEQPTTSEAQSSVAPVSSATTESEAPESSESNETTAVSTSTLPQIDLEETMSTPTSVTGRVSTETPSDAKLSSTTANGLNSVLATPATSPPQPDELPDFSEPIGNHTVALGRDAQLSCKINNLANFRTAWLRVEDKGILTIHNKIITRNYRIGLNDDGKNFVLTIKNVQASDKGGYMCQINSVPMRYAIGYLDVLTPPYFDDLPPQTPSQDSSQEEITTTLMPGSQTASVVTINEGGNANLSCRANGHPTPVITWRREDNEPILLTGSSNLDGVAKIEGPSILLSTVNRINSGAYLCIASNGVQPSASKRQVLDVRFSPIIRLPQTEVGAQLNQAEAKLTCFVELNPLGTYHWVKLDATSATSRQTGNDDMLIEHDELVNSDKFDIVIKQISSEKVLMTLVVRQLDRQDFAWYKCIARNLLGTQSSSIHLYESSSFSLNNIFRSSDGGSETTDPQRQQQQNDQQQDKPAKQNSILTRTHTRSSWIQRGRQSHDFTTPSSALLDSSISSSASATMTLLFYHHYILLCLITLLVSVAQALVEKCL